MCGVDHTCFSLGGVTVGVTWLGYVCDMLLYKCEVYVGLDYASSREAGSAVRPGLDCLRRNLPH